MNVLAKFVLIFLAVVCLGRLAIDEATKSQGTTSVAAQATPAAALPGTAQFDRQRRAKLLLARVADIHDNTIVQCHRMAQMYPILAAKALVCEVRAHETYSVLALRLAGAEHSENELGLLAQKINEFEMEVGLTLRNMERVR